MALAGVHRHTTIAVAALGVAAAGVLALGGLGEKSPEASLSGPVIKANAAAVFEKVSVPADAGKVEALEITVRPAIVPKTGSMLLQVQLFDATELVQRGPEAVSIASGTVGFFPTATIGVAQSFTIPIAAEQRARAVSGAALSARISVLPANPAHKLSETAIEVVSARLK